MPAFADVVSAAAAADLVTLLAALRAETEGETSGATIFRRRCAVCHGEDGQGDGPLAPELVPRPRDLTRPWYRFRSTPSGVRPRRSDIAQTLRRGLGVTAMNSFAALGPERVEAVARHVASLAEAVADAESAVVPGAVVADAASIERGRTMYDEARCWQCHGTAGRGDGPSARELRDDAGTASLPANLTQRWRLKGGTDVAALTRAIAHGLNGTPMPSYADVLDDDDLRAVAVYVASLGRERPTVPERLPVRPAAGALADDPGAAFWGQERGAAVPLGPQTFRAPRWTRPAVDVVDLALAWSEEGLAIRLGWDDRFEDREDVDGTVVDDGIDDPTRAGRWRLPDQVAVQVARVRQGEAWPPLYLGSPTWPVARWGWSAAGGPWVEDARGPGDVRRRPDGLLAATARFGDGRWQLVLVRRPGDDERVLVPGASLVIAVHAWDGSEGEYGTRHALSSWMPVTLPDR